jgi:hypothetical protein
MTWIKIKDILINLNNVTFVEKKNNKIIISPVIEITAKSEEYANQIFETIIRAIQSKNNLLDIDLLFDIEKAIELK